jgi:hypothetical protein
MEQKGFLGALFDFSFDHFITTRLVRLLYGLLILGAVGFSLVTMVTSWASSSSAIGGLLKVVVLTPLAFIVVVVMARIGCEGILVLFRIQSHAAELVRLAGSEPRSRADVA